MNKGRIGDFIIVILPLIVNDLLHHANNIFRAFINYFSKLSESISFKSVESIMPRILYGSFDQGSGICARILSFEPVFEPIDVAVHLYSFRPEHASNSLIVFSISNSVLCDPSNVKFVSSVNL